MRQNSQLPTYDKRKDLFMKIIGITGGVGAGKSTVLNMLKELCRCEVIMADDVAKEIMVQKGELSDTAVRLFGKKAYLPDGSLNRPYIAGLIYGDENLRKKWDDAVHPVVNDRIFSMIGKCREEGIYDFVFVEAALLIENHYDEICDEIWYIYASAQTRKKRLLLQRNYSGEESDNIMKRQMSDKEFREHCSFVINTECDMEHMRKVLKNRLEEYEN